jgi:cyclic lactone autoinducer peptide
MKNLIAKFSGIIAALALLVTAANMNVTCAIIMHQPKLPEGAEKLRRL